MQKKNENILRKKSRLKKKLRGGAVFLLFLLVVTDVYGEQYFSHAAEPLAQIFQKTLADGQPDVFLPGDLHLLVTRDQLNKIYLQRDYTPLWIEDRGEGSRASTARNALLASAEEGLKPEEYGIDLINLLWFADDLQSLALLDLTLTAAVLSYVHDLRYGSLQPKIVQPALFAEAGNPGFSCLDACLEITSQNDLQTYLDGLLPQHSYYKALKLGLSHYRKMGEQGGWPVVPEGKTLRPGDRDEKVCLMRTRFVIEGFLEKESADIDNPMYDENFQNAVTLFQRKYGLKDDGIVGPATYKALQFSIDDAIATITANLARWRWQDHQLGSKYVMVNIAHFELIGVKDNQISLRLPVVVGANRHQTPVFSNMIRYVELNPYWTIPPSIAAKEELPALKKQSDNLVIRNIRLFSGWGNDAVELDSMAIDWEQISARQMRQFRLRQDFGPWNALGRLKFVFPNPYDVYLHDTPQKDLFAKTKRNFSHGCIRVGSPEKLAAFLLEDAVPSWSEEKIIDEISLTQNKIISLSSKVPVHLTYQTAWADSAGNVHFNEDIYNRDEILIEALSK